MTINSKSIKYLKMKFKLKKKTFNQKSKKLEDRIKRNKKLKKKRAGGKPKLC
jgi:hypothetical protein